MPDLWFAYTIATGRLFMTVEELQLRSEELLGRPIMAHEFSDARTWSDLRGALDAELMEEAADA